MTDQKAAYGIHTDRADGVPGLLILRDFAGAFFVFTLVADLVYARTVIVMWHDFASWMLFAGLVAGALSVLLWLVGLALHRQRPNWPVVILSALVLIAATVNAFLHAGDGWTAIVPWGLALSVVTCVLMLASAVLSRLARRHANYHR